MNPRKFKLIFPAGRHGTAFLTWNLECGERVSAPLQPRLARILIVLREARLQDGGALGEPADGWRTRKRIARRIAEITGDPIEVTSVSAYGTMLTRLLDAAVHEVSPGERISLIERRPLLGYRLAEGVDIDLIDGSGAEDPDGGDPQGQS